MPGLYVHIPFCRSRCAYCAFDSGMYDASLVDAYIDALALEVRRSGVFGDIHAPETIFIGGGTPSTLTELQLERLLSILPSPVSGGEYSIELNPDSTTRDKLALLFDKGVSRCSFGVQTFSERGLRFLGRRHGVEQAVEMVGLAVGMGFDSVSVDLIAAWPSQTEDELVVDLEMAVGLGVRHVSCYGLMIEEGTAFAGWLEKRRISEKGEGEKRRFWEVVEGVLGERGFGHYEVSNFARDGFVCRHNVDVWKGGEYWGVGSSAHSHWGGRRFANTREVGEYIERQRAGESAEVFSERLESGAKARECVVFWLRLAEGVEEREFFERTGFGLRELYGEELVRLVDEGKLVWRHGDDGRVYLAVTPRWYPLLDDILVDLV